MNRFLRSKVILSLAALMMIATAIAIPLSGSILHSHASSNSSSVSPWPLQGFNESNNAFNSAENTITTQNVAKITSKWSNAISGAFNAEAPVVDNGRVYLEQGADLYGLNETTGNSEWHINMLNYGSSAYATVPPQLSNGKLYIVTQDETIRAFDALDDTKPQLWSASSGWGFTISSNGVIYTSTPPTTFSFGNMVAYDANTGSQIWSHSAPCYTGYSRPAIDVQLGVGFIACPSGSDEKLFAFHLSDGSQAWSAPIAHVYGTSVVLANGLVYAAGVAGSQGSSNLEALNEQTGSVVWSQEVGNNTIDTLPVIVNGMVYVEYSVLNGSNGSEGVAGLNATSGNTVWTQYPFSGSPHYTENERLAVANGILYVGAGNFFAFDAITGTQLLELMNSSTVSYISDPVIADGMIFEWTENYNTRLYTLEAFSLPNITPTPSPSPSPNPSVTLSVSIDDILCTSTLKFSVQNAKPDQIRISRNGLFLRKLPGSAKTYTDTATGTFAGYAYELYEVAAFLNGRFLALARSYIPVDQSCFNGNTPPAYPNPPIADSQNDLFFIVGGINSNLSANTPINSTETQAAGNNGYGYDPAWETYDSSPRIASYLMWNGYLNSRFINFSYSSNATTYTNDGMPKPFTCVNTFDNGTNSTFFQQEVLALSKQIQAAVAGRTNIRLHILAHSQGGVLALAYTFALAKNLDGVTPLPTGVTLHDVDLYDSPVGGTRYNSNYLNNLILKLGCSGASKFNDVKQMHTLFLTATDTTEYGKSASIVGTFFGLNPTDPNNSNQSVAAFSHQTLGVTIFIPGNDNDYLWNPSDCRGGATFRSTENLINDEPNGIESRRFTSSSDVLGCAASISNTFNHLDVLSDPNVQQATLQVIQGITPGLTPYTG